MRAPVGHGGGWLLSDVFGRARVLLVGAIAGEREERGRQQGKRAPATDTQRVLGGLTRVWIRSSLHLPVRDEAARGRSAEQNG